MRFADAVRRATRPSSGARRYLAPGTDLEEFFQVLQEQDVSYVVLRWFEGLPAVEPGEDVDLLVSDEDLPRVQAMLVDRQGRHPGQKLDVYSTSGMPRSDFKGIPYYAPDFSRGILARAVWQDDRFRVPSPQDHFDSLAYHAVYHKGWASGLAPAPGEPPRGDTDHDYAQVLSDLAASLGLEVDVTLLGLDAYLADKDLRPPLDTLERLAPSNPWVVERFLDCLPPVDPVWAGLCVFVLRERAVHLVEEARVEVDRQGFEVVEVLELDESQRAAAAHRLRGSNWERGPWPRSGGRPGAYLITYDVAPRVDDPTDPRAPNARIPKVKLALRDHLLDGVPADSLYNPVHSSDNAGQALDYLDVLGDPALLPRLREQVDKLVETCAFPFPVTRPLSTMARRARVAVVEHPLHGQAVCKVFRPGAARFFAREVLARTELADLPEMPALLELGDNWLLCPLYRDDRRHVVRGLPGTRSVQLQPWASRALVRLAEDLHDRGLFLLDLSSDNVLSDPDAGLKVLDLEFLQEYAGDKPALRDSYTFRGLPRDAAAPYDAPQVVSDLVQEAGSPAFHPAVTGMRLDEVLTDGSRSLALRRPVLQVGWFLRYWAQHAGGRARVTLSASRRVRRARRAAALVRDLRQLRR